VKNFLISVDSSASFSDEELSEYGFLMVHLSYTLDGKEYVDVFESDTQKQIFYDRLSAGSLAQSSKANPEGFRKIWEQPLRDGADILHLSLSSKVSGSYESACHVAEELTEKYGGKIEVIDTGTGSFAITALALELAKQQSSLTIDEAKRIAQNSLNEYNLIFTVGDIKYLRRGGRVSHIKALLGGLLHLKPVLFINGEGYISLIANARGMRQAMEFMAQKMKNSETEQTRFAYIAHGGDHEMAQRLKDKIKEAFPGLRNFIVDYLTPVLGLHAGPGSLILCFRGASRENVLADKPIKELLERLHLKS
jgi:DegV family protein with EDD domain